jgi:hypothetical protein
MARSTRTPYRSSRGGAHQYYQKLTNDFQMTMAGLPTFLGEIARTHIDLDEVSASHSLPGKGLRSPEPAATSVPSEYRQPTLGHGLHTFLEIFGLEMLLLLGELVVDDRGDRVGKASTQGAPRGHDGERRRL